MDVERAAAAVRGHEVSLSERQLHLAAPHRRARASRRARHLERVGARESRSRGLPMTPAALRPQAASNSAAAAVPGERPRLGRAARLPARAPPRRDAVESVACRWRLLFFAGQRPPPSRPSVAPSSSIHRLLVSQRPHPRPPLSALPAAPLSLRRCTCLFARLSSHAREPALAPRLSPLPHTRTRTPRSPVIPRVLDLRLLGAIKAFLSVDSRPG
ncbi:hypothetical protein FA09DRAFT_172861 [Tilletiopsis washingtonensis]|uniref:Uncharacterized protein n=1 Tax=Tilletiopsis washingtonensis TaxID=58919 RepID=A0A316YYY1_9BASI|nr:hypothetical protein FA09DRAFT_172861 [Tilletiopsis washingtonensis]PWN94677.1 hypothetical protein FA09DRAFT_172861 [Tilletiopsis washingtonensis]